MISKTFTSFTAWGDESKLLITGQNCGERYFSNCYVSTYSKKSILSQTKLISVHFSAILQSQQKTVKSKKHKSQYMYFGSRNHLLYIGDIVFLYIKIHNFKKLEILYHNRYLWEIQTIEDLPQIGLLQSITY
jgi:hypothetical protein